MRAQGGFHNSQQFTRHFGSKNIIRASLLFLKCLVKTNVLDIEDY